MAKAKVQEKEVVDILDQDIDISKVEVLLFMLESSTVIDGNFSSEPIFSPAFDSDEREIIKHKALSIISRW